jgi:hypothetical protein
MAKAETAKAPSKVPVTERALVQRINRRLAQDDRMLRKSRTRVPYRLIDTKINGLLDDEVDPEEMGRALGVLAEWEALESPDPVKVSEVAILQTCWDFHESRMPAPDASQIRVHARRDGLDMTLTIQDLLDGLVKLGQLKAERGGYRITASACSSMRTTR